MQTSVEESGKKPDNAATIEGAESAIVRYTRWLMIFTGVLAVVAVIQIGFLIGAYRTASESANAARDAVELSAKTAERQLRAYVYFDKPTAREWPQPPQTPNRLSLIVDVVNSGSTWARKLTSQAGIVKLEAGDNSDPFEHVDWTKDAPPPITYGPNQRMSVQVGEVSFVEARAIRDGKLQVFAVGLIKYEDILSFPPVLRKTHMSRLFKIDTEGTYAFSYVQTHNCADDDCPK